ncbi:HobA family DNA replication regulator, partial [Campylobacter jejuni]
MVPSKNLLLPTIKSRLICEKRKVEKEVKKLDLDLKRMDLRMLFDFLQKNENLDKNELMDQIALLAKECVKYKDFTLENIRNGGAFMAWLESRRLEWAPLMAARLKYLLEGRTFVL